MDSSQKAIVTDAIDFADALRLPENTDLLRSWLNHKPQHDILDAMFYSTERRMEWRKSFGEDMPENVISAEQYSRLKAIEHKIDEHSGHSGASWGYMEAVTKVILGANRSHMYMNWINQAEELKAGSTEPLSEADLAKNATPIVTDNGTVIYDASVKSYVPFVAPAVV